MFDDRLPTVLIVDDDAAVRDWLKLSLGLRGWVVSSAASGDEALSEVDELGPDLVILDHEMPGMTGMACAKDLRRRGVANPIILFSAFIDHKRTAQAERLDVQPISKVDQPALFRTIDALYEQLLEDAAAAT